MSRKSKRFIEDERAIEGLPIRLVIALVVGVAALGIMMAILDFPLPWDQEVTVELDEAVIENGSTVNITVVDEDGDLVEGATVLVEGGSVPIQERIKTVDASNGTAQIDVGSDVTPKFRSDQQRGSIEFTVIPPTDSSYVDESSNPELIVIDS